MRHHPGLDGLRAIAVIAVIIFHGQLDALPGGYLGVDMFFVLSGYLITTLLIAEAERSGTIDLARFWARRFRRLLPAVLVLLVAVAGFAVWFAAPERRGEIRWDSLASLAYVANWRFIASGHSYFDTISAPSPVQHLWSLAVEEQWYLVWPFVCTLTLGMRRARRLGRRTLATIIVAATVASTVAMSIIASRPGDPSRAYYGTDTRAQTLLIGAGLALVLRNVSLGHVTIESTRLRAAMIGAWLLAAGAVIAAFTWVDDSKRWMYHGGFAAFAIVSAVLIAGVMIIDGLDRLVGVEPLGWIGRRSYGLYLWHWPLGLVLSASRTGLHGWQRFAVATAATVVATELSYRFVEQPIRLRRWRIPHSRIIVPSTMAIIAALLLLATSGSAEVPLYARQDKQPGPPIVMEPSTSSTTSTVSTSSIVTPTITAPTGTTPVATPPRHPRRVLLLGDSIAVSLSSQLGKDLVAKGIAFTSYAFPGCGVVTGTPVDINGTTLVDCPVIAQTQRTAVRAARPDLVVLSSTWESSHREVDGVVYRAGTPQWREELIKLYGETVARVTTSGARVALLLQPDITDGASTSADPAVNNELHQLNDVLRAVAARDPERITLIDLSDVVCPTTPCPYKVNGTAYRPKDGRHFEMPEAKPVAAAFAQRIATLDL